MSTLRTSAIALVLAAGTAAGVTGCSSKEAPKAKDAWNKAQDTLGTYKSMEIKGDGTSEGKPATMTMKGDVKGDPMSLSGKLNGGSVEMINVGSKSYMKADEAFFKGSDSTKSSPIDPAKFSNVWLEMPKSSGSNNESFTSLVKDIQDDSSESNKKLLSDKATVSEDEVDGKDAWKIVSEDKKVTAWVSQDDSRDILKVEGTDAFKEASTTSKDTMKTATFVSHDKDYGIKAPSGAKSMQDLVMESMK